MAYLLCIILALPALPQVSAADGSNPFSSIDTKIIDADESCPMDGGSMNSAGVAMIQRRATRKEAVSQEMRKSHSPEEETEVVLDDDGMEESYEPDEGFDSLELDLDLELLEPTRLPDEFDFPPSDGGPSNISLSQLPPNRRRFSAQYVKMEGFKSRYYNIKFFNEATMESSNGNLQVGLRQPAVKPGGKFIFNGWYGYRWPATKTSGGQRYLSWYYCKPAEHIAANWLIWWTHLILARWNHEMTHSHTRRRSCPGFARKQTNFNLNHSPHLKNFKEAVRGQGWKDFPNAGVVEIFRDAQPWSKEKCRGEAVEMPPKTGDKWMWQCQNGECITANLRCNGVCDCSKDCEDERFCNLKIHWGLEMKKWNNVGKCLTGATASTIKHRRRRVVAGRLKASLATCSNVAQQVWYFYGNQLKNKVDSALCLEADGSIHTGGQRIFMNICDHLNTNQYWRWDTITQYFEVKSYVMTGENRKGKHAFRPWKNQWTVDGKKVFCARSSIHTSTRHRCDDSLCVEGCTDNLRTMKNPTAWWVESDGQWLRSHTSVVLRAR